MNRHKVRNLWPANNLSGRKGNVIAPHAAEQTAPPANDTEQVQRALTGDVGAFRAIMQTHNRRLYRIARSILRNNADAEDAVQEAYVSAFTNLASYHGEGTLKSWLARIVINESLGRIRQRHSSIDLATLEQQQGEAQIIQFPQSTPNDDPERTMAQRQIIQLVEQATDNLPEAFRLVFVTRVIEGMSTEETTPSTPRSVRNSRCCRQPAMSPAGLRQFAVTQQTRSLSEPSGHSASREACV